MSLYIIIIIYRYAVCIYYGLWSSDHVAATQTAGARADPDFSGIRVSRVCVCVPIPPTNCPTRNLSPATCMV